MPEPDGRRQQTDFAGGGEMRTAPGLSPNGWNRGAGGIILMTRAIWLQDGSVWTVSGIIWIGKMGDLYVNCWTPDHYWVGPDGVYVPGK